MKKCFLVILACLLGISGSGCAVTQVLENKAENQKHAEEISKKLIRYINKKDVDGIEKLFNQYSQNEDKLREDIKDFLDCIDGEIEDYNFNYRGDVSSSIRDGKWTKQETETKLENIITDTEKKYHINFGEYMIYTEDKDKEGIVYLILYDEKQEFIFGICYE
ncbi:MAG: DUF5104 domain-containing protein [Lachnospiraceae bacterium]|nr:DUF5104 domain-containing protein [Lachnospiraceae bacterium]